MGEIEERLIANGDPLPEPNVYRKYYAVEAEEVSDGSEPN
jgi:hypothetical protein